jgi:hypothetical protein
MARGADYDNEFPRFLSKEEIDERRRKREERLARPVHYLPAQDTVARNPHWLWYRFLAYRTYSILACKLQDVRIFVACEIMARLSQLEGADMPDGHKTIGDKKSLVIADLDVTTTFMPVLRALGARMENIKFLAPTEDMFFQLHNLNQLIRYRRDYPFDFAYVDEPTNYLGGANASRNEEVKPILWEFCQWLRAYESCFLLGMSVNKHGSEIDIYDRIFGCTEFRKKAAIAMMVTEDDQGLQLALGETRFVGHRLKQVVRWDEREDGWYDCRGLADRAHKPDDDPGPAQIYVHPLDEAGDFLLKLYEEKHQWTWTEIEERAKPFFINKRYLYQFRDETELGKRLILLGTWNRDPNFKPEPFDGIFGSPPA